MDEMLWTATVYMLSITNVIVFGNGVLVRKLEPKNGVFMEDIGSLIKNIAENSQGPSAM